MAFPHLFSLPAPVYGLVYLTAYVLLDWISFIQPFGPYGITPWNPPTGLSFVFILLFGQRFIPLLYVAPFLADIAIRHLPFNWPIQIASVLIIGSGYAFALMFLLRPATRFNPTLSSMRDLFLLMLTAGVSATAVSLCYVGLLVIAGLVPAQDFLTASLRYWVGDLIGIAVICPFLLILLTRRRLPRLSAESVAQSLAILAALWIVFGHVEEHHFQLFYLLFLPVVWMAVRGGLEGVTIGILITQLGLIVGVKYLLGEHVDITAFQSLMLVLTLTGLMAGVLVTERRRMEYQLRLHQDSVARLGRLGSMGELAAAVAHEINQPLTAAGTYARLVVDSLRANQATTTPVVETAEKAATQVQRAADVLRNLRALIRLDQSGRAPSTIEHIVREALDLCQPELDRHNIKVNVEFGPALPSVMVDVLQIEQVLLNVIRNSIEAIHQAGHAGGTIAIAARRAADGTAEIRVRDTGPGFPPEFRGDQFPPLSSTKAGGLGVGLSLCRTIVESHAGRLTVGSDPGGAVVCFTLPTAKAADA